MPYLAHDCVGRAHTSDPEESLAQAGLYSQILQSEWQQKSWRSAQAGMQACNIFDA